MAGSLLGKVRTFACHVIGGVLMATNRTVRKLFTALAVVALAFGALGVSGSFGAPTVTIADGGHQSGDYDPG